MDGYFLVDRARSGAENMEVDQWMVERSAETGIPVVRFYQWSEPTLSLGYFQSFEERQAHQASREVSTVRRGTGGGAILHHHDWTVAIAMPEQVLRRERVSAVGAASSLYDAVHVAVVDWLNARNVHASLHSRAETTTLESDRTGGSPTQVVGCSVGEGQRGCPFLCFERRSDGDVIVDGWKVMGSAQRRVQGAVLQHGSILLKRSPFAPSLPGLIDLGALDEGANQYGSFQDAIVEAVEKQFSIHLQESSDELGEAWAKFSPSGKFASLDWLHKR